MGSQPAGVDLLLCGAFLWLPDRLARSDFFDRCDASWTPQDCLFETRGTRGKESQTGDFGSFEMFFHRKNLGQRCSNRMSLESSDGSLAPDVWPYQDQRHPLPKPSWYLHGAPSRADLTLSQEMEIDASVSAWERMHRKIGMKGQQAHLSAVYSMSRPVDPGIEDSDLGTCS